MSSIVGSKLGKTTWHILKKALKLLNALLAYLDLVLNIVCEAKISIARWRLACCCMDSFVDQCTCCVLIVEWKSSHTRVTHRISQ